MRRPFAFPLWLWLAGLPLQGAVPAAPPPPQEVVDRIVVRIEDDIITLTEMRQLAAYQQLVEGHAEPDERLRSELIEQWVINNEAVAAHFPEPAASEVDREVTRIESRFPTQQAFRDRLTALSLSADDVRNMVAREIYLARYLDYKFRPSVQVSDDDVAKYYRDTLVPEIAAKGEKPPTLSAASDQISELLIQRGIDDRAVSWLDQTKSRLKIEIEAAGAPSTSTPTQPATTAR